MFLRDEDGEGKKKDGEVKTKRQQEKRPDVWRRAKPTVGKKAERAARASDTPRFRES